jgi:hypothetical protein
MRIRLCKKWIVGAIGAAVVATTFMGCEPGPAERAGEKIDRAFDRLSGKGPAEKAGERIDKAVKELKK